MRLAFGVPNIAATKPPRQQTPDPEILRWAGTSEKLSAPAHASCPPQTAAADPGAHLCADPSAGSGKSLQQLAPSSARPGLSRWPSPARHLPPPCRRFGPARMIVRERYALFRNLFSPEKVDKNDDGFIREVVGAMKDRICYHGFRALGREGGTHIDETLEYASRSAELLI